MPQRGFDLNFLGPKLIGQKPLVASVTRVHVMHQAAGWHFPLGNPKSSSSRVSSSKKITQNYHGSCQQRKLLSRSFRLWNWEHNLLDRFFGFLVFFSPIVGGEMKERSLQVIRDQAVKSHILDGLFCNSIIVRNGFLGLIWGMYWFAVKVCLFFLIFRGKAELYDEEINLFAAVML